MKTNLSPVFRDFKKDVEENFKELAKFIPKGDNTIVKQVNSEFDKRYDQLIKEIRAIIMPEVSPK